MNLALWLERNGCAFPDAPAVGFGDDLVHGYGALAHRASCLAGSLRNDRRIMPGARIALVSQNCAAYVEVIYGIWGAGAVVVPVNAKLHPAEIQYILDHSGSSIAFVSSELAPSLAATGSLKSLVVIGSAEYDRMLCADPVCVLSRTADDLAWLFYTSGTTGRPKGACLSHGNLAAMAHAYVAEVDATAPGDVLYHAAPMSHGSGLYLVAGIMRGAVNVVPESGRFEPDEVLRASLRWPRLSLFAAPTMVRRLVGIAGGFDPRGIRTIIYGGGPMYVADAVEAFRTFGPRLAQIYGQGETPMTITTLSRADIGARDHPRWHDRLASVGRAFACMKVAVFDEEDKPVPAGEPGEIVCRGPTVMTGYWQDEAATAATLRGGWLHTGDIGVIDEGGYLTLKDRSKDLIVAGGTNIYPREVEEALLSHPEIREVSVIGRPDPEWGEIVVAYAVGTATVEELDALCLGRIARFKRPRHYVFVDALPKNNYGKVLKTELRALDRREA